MGFVPPNVMRRKQARGGAPVFTVLAESMQRVAQSSPTLVPMHNQVGKPIHSKGTHGHREQDRNRAESRGGGKGQAVTTALAVLFALTTAA